MQSYTYRKNPFNEIVCSQPAFIFDNSLKFSTSYGIFHFYPNACNFFVVVFLFFGKLLYLSFLNRLYNCLPFRSIYPWYPVSWYKVQGKNTLYQPFFIMRFTANSLTDKDDQSGLCYDNDILYRMTFLLSAVFLSLFIIVYRMGNLSFSTIMKQYRRPSSLESSVKREESSVSIYTGTSPIVSRLSRRICVRQWTKMLQCFQSIPKQAAWYSCKGLFFR